NTSVSLPLTLLTLNRNHTCSILEMGASQRGDIGRLCRIANPTHGIITNIAPAHLEGFGSIEDVARTKAELFEALDSGLSFINVSDKRIKKLHTAGKTITFGFSSDSDYSADIFQKQDGTLILIIEAHEINTGSQNNSFAKNVLSVTAIARELGIRWDIIKRRVLTFSPLEGRCRIIKFGELTIIDDTYNANPESTFSAIDFLLALQDGGQKIFIFGDMFELGKDSYEQHRNIGLKCIQSGLSAVLTIGSETRATDSALNGSLYHKHFDDKESLLKNLKKILKNGDKILIKGSRGLAMETIVKKLQEN
ncbi:MAG: Mur ligase family protein, partial [Candidatus Neomarinimicrobiota bacterium]